MAIRTGIALCSGIGGLELGISLVLGPYYSTVCYVERETFPAALLVQRMEDGVLDHAPVWSDLRTFDGRRWRGCVDIISAGIPCQPFSVAGKREGLEDERWIWEDVARIIREVRPRLIFLENVPGIVQRGLGPILGTLAEGGYSAEWDLFRASDVGAPHKRERWFLLADSDGDREVRSQPGDRCGGGAIVPGDEKLADSDIARCEGTARSRDEGKGGKNVRPTNSGEKLADADGGRLERLGEQHSEPFRGRRASFGGYPSRCIQKVGNPNLPRLEGRRISEREGSYQFPPWPPSPSEPSKRFRSGIEPSICRTSNGIPNRIHRLRCLGNGVVPAMGALAFRTLLGRIHGW